MVLSSGLSPSRVAADLGIGKSTLKHWISQYPTIEQRWPRLFGQFLGLNKLYPVVVMPPF
ncbi:helix-turn-helix domain-containing protein [Gluconobacter kondonii]|nr:helix-turn-helix domain-containing protein [Gluconobacter kondonii]